jgi:phage-related protein
MPIIGRRCHELRAQDEDSTGRIVYRVDADAVIVLEVFSKKTSRTPRSVIEACRQRLRHYDEPAGHQER